MKKIIIGLLFLLSINCLRCQPQLSNIASSQEKSIVQQISQLEQMLSQLRSQNLRNSKIYDYKEAGNHLISVLFKIQNTFKYIVDKADKMLSKKTALAVLIVIGPFLYGYSKFFNPGFIKSLLSLFSQSAVEGGATIATPMAQGAIKGALNVLWENKFTILSISSITIPLIIGGTAAIAAGSIIGVEAAKQIGAGLGKKLVPVIIAKIMPIIA